MSVVLLITLYRVVLCSMFQAYTECRAAKTKSSEENRGGKSGRFSVDEILMYRNQFKSKLLSNTFIG